ncbi:MAG: hypothetical protein ACP5DX_01790 [Paracoccaceae bacterium]
MKTTLAVLFATTALSASAAIPTIGDSGMQRHAAAIAAEADAPAGAVLVAERDDDDEHEGRWLRRIFGDDDDHRRRGHDDDDDDDDDDCDDDDGRGCRGGMNPAPAGTVAPPANGLFNNGAAPKVQVN